MGANLNRHLLAFLLNAAVPPLGAWLPDAYPEASATGAVFLTAFTTKSAVYALIRGFAGTEISFCSGFDDPTLPCDAVRQGGVTESEPQSDVSRLNEFQNQKSGEMTCTI